MLTAIGNADLVIRLILVIVVSLLTVRYATRGLQNGMCIFLVASMWPPDQVWFFRSIAMLPIIVTPERVIWLVLLLVFVMQWKRGKIQKHRPSPIEYCMIALVVFILMNMYFHQSYTTDKFTDSIGGARAHFSSFLNGFLLPFLAYYIMHRVSLTSLQARSLLTGIGLITIYLSIIGVAEAAGQNWLVFPKYVLNPRVGIHMGQVRGPFLNASWNGLAMSMGLPILVWLAIVRNDRTRPLWVLGLILAGVAILFVLQRAAWLGAAAALTLTLLAWPKRSTVGLGVVLLIIGGVGWLLPVLPESMLDKIGNKVDDSGTIEYRLIVAQTTWKIIQDHAWTGVGFNRFNSELVEKGLESWYSSHNTPLTLFAELGALGFLLYIAVFGLLLFKSAKAYRTVNWLRPLIGALWGITAAYLIMTLAVEIRLTIYPNVLLFALWGLLLGIAQRQSLSRSNPNHAFALTRGANLAIAH